MTKPIFFKNVRSDPLPSYMMHDVTITPTLDNPYGCPRVGKNPLKNPVGTMDDSAIMVLL